MTETLSPTLPADVEALVVEVLRMACERRLKLVTAESCTGGLLASLLTDVDGSAHAFERGFVTYAEAAKIELLDVPASLLKRHTAVSRQAAEAMARGALANSHADVAVSITGFAGQGAQGEEPGLVHFAVARHGCPISWHEAHFGDVGRGPVRVACLRQALQMLRASLGEPAAPEPGTDRPGWLPDGAQAPKPA